MLVFILYTLCGGLQMLLSHALRCLHARKIRRFCPLEPSHVGPRIRISAKRIQMLTTHVRYVDDESWACVMVEFVHNEPVGLFLFFPSSSSSCLSTGLISWKPFNLLLLQISCGSCQFCADPEPFEDIDVIFQIFQLSDTTASIWLDSKIDVAGVQGENVCTSKSLWRYVNVRNI